jgi:hypothetical protein
MRWKSRTDWCGLGRARHDHIHRQQPADLQDRDIPPGPQRRPLDEGPRLEREADPQQRGQDQPDRDHPLPAGREGGSRQPPPPQGAGRPYLQGPVPHRRLGGGRCAQRLQGVAGVHRRGQREAFRAGHEEGQGVGRRVRVKRGVEGLPGSPVLRLSRRGERLTVRGELHSLVPRSVRILRGATDRARSCIRRNRPRPSSAGTGR